MLEKLNSAYLLFQRSLKQRLSSSLGQNTAWALAGYGLRLLIQAIYFVIIARYLGPNQYGGFVAVTALASVVSPFVGVGSGNLLVKHVARNRAMFSECWGNGLLLTFLSGILLAAITAGFSLSLLPPSIALTTVVLVCVSDLLFVKFLDMAAWAFQSFEMLSQYAQLNVLISLMRLAGIVGLAVLAPRPTIVAWSAVYLAGSFLAALIGVAWATASFGMPTLELGRVRAEIVEGFHFSVSLSAQTIYNDIDKTMVARLSTLQAAGIYAAAYRLIDVTFIPVRALLNAAYPVFFRHGTTGFHASLRFGRRLLLQTIAYPLFAFVALLAGASFVPLILGRGYSEVTEALRWLSLLPLLKTLHYFVADSLTGAGFQRLRTIIQVGIAAFNFTINLWLIPSFGWRGAAWASIASDGLLAAGLWCAATVLILRQSRALQATEELV